MVEAGTGEAMTPTPSQPALPFYTPAPAPVRCCLNCGRDTTTLHGWCDECDQEMEPIVVVVTCDARIDDLQYHGWMPDL